MKLRKAFAAPLAIGLALGLAACGTQAQTTPQQSGAASSKPSLSSTSQDIKATARDGVISSLAVPGRNTSAVM